MSLPSLTTPTGPDPEPTLTRPQLGYGTNTIEEIEKTERRLGVSPAVISTYTDFTSPFPDRWAEEAEDRSVPLLLSWEPWDWHRGYVDQPEYALAAIANGAHDDYIRDFAQDAKDAEVVVLLRFAAEMNGDWQVWWIGDTPSDYQNAWRRIHRIFKEEDASNVRFVFNPNVHYEGATPIEAYWPGGRYVDWVALDGYNWTGIHPSGKPYPYLSPAELFNPSVATLRKLGPSKPLLIAETGSGPIGKTKWVRQMASWAPQAGVHAVVWFEHDKETDWRLLTHPQPKTIKPMLVKNSWRVTTPVPRGVTKDRVATR